MKRIILRKALDFLFRDVVLPATRRIGTAVASTAMTYGVATDTADAIPVLVTAAAGLLWDWSTSYIDRNLRGQ